MKELAVSRVLLLDAVDKIIATCERPSATKGHKVLPHFFYIKLNGYGDKLRLSAHNMFRQIEVLISEVTAHEPFCLGVTGASFSELIKNISDDLLTFRYESGFTVKTQKSWYSLATLSGDRFPDIELVTQKDWQEVDYEELFDVFGRIVYCSANGDADRTFTKAVSVTDTHFYCTDGNRLSVYPNKIIKCDRPFLLPIESIKSYSNLFRDKDCSGFISVDKCKIYFSKKNVYATSSLYTGAIPDYKSVAPEGVYARVSVLKGPLLRALKRLAIFSKALSKRSLPVSIVFSKNELCLNLDNPDFQSQAKEVIECLYDGPTTKLSANIGYIYQAVKSIKEDPAILELRGSHYSIVITDEKGEHKNVIIPYR